MSVKDANMLQSWDDQGRASEYCWRTREFLTLLCRHERYCFYVTMDRQHVTYWPQERCGEVLANTPLHVHQESAGRA